MTADDAGFYYSLTCPCGTRLTGATGGRAWGLADF